MVPAIHDSIRICRGNDAVECNLSCLEPIQPALEEGEVFEIFWPEVFGKSEPPLFNQVICNSLFDGIFSGSKETLDVVIIFYLLNMSRELHTCTSPPMIHSPQVSCSMHGYVCQTCTKAVDKRGGREATQSIGGLGPGSTARGTAPSSNSRWEAFSKRSRDGPRISLHRRLETSACTSNFKAVRCRPEWQQRGTHIRRVTKPTGVGVGDIQLNE